MEYNMVNIPVIAKRELKAYFLSPIAFIILTVFAITQGLLFCIYIGSGRVVPDSVVQFSFWVHSTLMVVAAPIITMRLISQEKREGTIEPLLTSPTTETDVILGKFSAALIFSVSLTSPIILELFFLSTSASLDYGIIAAGLLGLYLITVQFLSIGLFVSTLTRIQLSAAIITFVSLAILFLVWLLLRNHPSPLSETVIYLTPAPHFGNFVKGVVDTRDVVYFIATSSLCLFLAIHTLRFQKWR